MFPIKKLKEFDPSKKWTFRIKALNLFHEHGMPSMLPMPISCRSYIVKGWRCNTVGVIKVLIGPKFLRTSRRQVLRVFPWFFDKLVEGGFASAKGEWQLLLGQFRGTPTHNSTSRVSVSLMISPTACKVYPRTEKIFLDAVRTDKFMFIKGFCQWNILSSKIGML